MAILQRSDIEELYAQGYSWLWVSMWGGPCVASIQETLSYMRILHIRSVNTIVLSKAQQLSTEEDIERTRSVWAKLLGDSFTP